VTVKARHSSLCEVWVHFKSMHHLSASWPTVCCQWAFQREIQPLGVGDPPLLVAVLAASMCRQHCAYDVCLKCDGCIAVMPFVSTACCDGPSALVAFCDDPLCNQPVFCNCSKLAHWCSMIMPQWLA
jgi:hypothetical protein